MLSKALKFILNNITEHDSVEMLRIENAPNQKNMQNVSDVHSQT